MKKIILWMLFFCLFWWAILGLKNSLAETEEQERIIEKQKIQTTIDSLQNVIDSLQLQIDTIQYESIDTTVIHWPWGREEFYYFKYKNNNDGDLLSALIFVESSDNDSAYRACEDAVGCLQIRKTMVDDINRILKRRGISKRYTYIDRWSRDRSIEMFNIYKNYYGLETPEEIARCWNGGPRGINNPSTVGYWEKVKNQINS